MSMEQHCTECEATSVNGILKHFDKCSASTPKPFTGNISPVTTIKFDSQKEADEWMEKLKKGISYDQ